MAREVKKDPIASLATLDPVANLAAAAIVKALEDFKGADPVASVDALCWWLSDAPIWLECLGLAPDDPDYVFMRLLGGGRNGKVSRPDASRDSEPAAA